VLLESQMWGETVIWEWTQLLASAQRGSHTCTWQRLALPVGQVNSYMLRQTTAHSKPGWWVSVHQCPPHPKGLWHLLRCLQFTCTWIHKSPGNRKWARGRVRL